MSYNIKSLNALKHGTERISPKNLHGVVPLSYYSRGGERGGGRPKPSKFIHFTLKYFKFD
jgi:hypothetical protein